MKKKSLLSGYLFLVYLTLIILAGCNGNKTAIPSSGNISGHIQGVKISSENGSRNVTEYVDTPDERSWIFPVPWDVQMKEGTFIIDTNTFILISQGKNKTDEFIAGLLQSEFSDRYGQPVRIVSKSIVSENDKFILIGDITNLLVKDYCLKNRLLNTVKELGKEGYLLTVSDKEIVVAANTQQGALYGFESLRQIINRREENLFVPQLVVKDSPQFPFRGIKLYLPGRENIPFFKRFIKDFAARYKYNTIILELNANMRLEKHPELNVGTVRFERHLNYSRLDRPPGLHNEFQNSSHQDNSDGQILEKDEVADIVSYIRKFNMEVIPELPSLTHAYYLLFGHENLAENMNQPFPDTYCPLKPENYKIFFDVLDEYIDVIHPEIIHVGHDEWRMEKDVCELCRGKDYGQLFADDLNRIYDYLKKRGIRTAIWGDHLLESVRQRDHQVWKSSSGYEYKIPGALTHEQVLKLIPKDILIFNWFWNKKDNDKQVSDFGFQQVYGNFTPDINEWKERLNTKGLLGGAPSSWAATTPNNFGKDQVMDFLGCANLLWSIHYLTPGRLVILTEPLVAEIYTDFRGRLLPGDAGSKVIPLSISSHLNSPLSEIIDSLKPSDLLTGKVKSGNKIFDLEIQKGTENRAVVVGNNKTGTGDLPGIEIAGDVNSIMFLHTCAREGRNVRAYTMIHNFDETAELLGWYEVIFEDGFVETIPVRYGLNILDWRWKKRVINNEASRVRNSQNQYAYMASAVECSVKESYPVTFFAWEWENTRPGKKIREIKLKPVINNGKNKNAIMLLAVSVTENPKIKNSTGKE